VEVPVRLSASATDIGTLQLTCRPLESSSEAAYWPEEQSWQFEFEILSQTGSSAVVAQSVAEGDVPEPHTRITQALSAIEEVFGKADAKAAKAHPPGQLRTRLEKTLGPRDSWNIATLRAMADQLLALQKRRRRSAAHERVWCWLLGYCLRPGYGMEGDAARMATVWGLFDVGIQYDAESQNQSQWWLLWRRVCGGLVPSEQVILAERVLGLLSRLGSAKRQKTKGKGAAVLKAQAAGQGDAVRLLGMLELLPAEERQSIGQRLLKMLQQDINNESLWWSLGRVGARQLVSVERYSPGAVQPLMPKVVAPWLETLRHCMMGKKSFPTVAAAFALMQMAQRTNEPQFNIEQGLADAIRETLQGLKVPDRWVAAIDQVCDQDEEDQSLRLGEQMPRGLRLVNR
jgi:hypothetical protein